jgi:hypothetical protein
VETEVEVETPHAPKVEKLYSPEEIKELVSTGDFTRIDTSRLSEEGKLVMKSMQSGLTPKLQEAAELRREMQELKESVQKALPKAQPKDIFEAYDQDPNAVTTFLNNNVQEAIASQDQVAIERAREDREQVRHYAVTKPVAVEPQLEANNIAVEMLKAVPDIQTKQEALLKHALEVMGYEREEVEQLTNLDRGHQAVREIVRINQSYDRHMAPKRAAEKEVKKTPPTVEKSGGGFEKNQTTGKDRIAQAKKSGTQSDWMDVFMNMED